MGVRLHAVAPAQGWRWVTRGFALWRQRPLAFVALFCVFMMAVLLLAVLVPVIGGALGLAMVPMLSLGYMIAARSALAGGPVHALQLIDGLRSRERRQRLAQWRLCGLYMVASTAIILLADWIDGGLFVDLQRLLAQAPEMRRADELEHLLADPRLLWGMLARLGLAGALSVPFWHAPALVHWGGQGVRQALFSSTVALWRARGAYTVYVAGWAAITAGIAALVTLGSLLLGLRSVFGMLALPIGLILTTAFYASLWFPFADGFGARSTGNSADVLRDDD